MTIEEVMGCLRDGKRVRRKAWIDVAYISMQGDQLTNWDDKDYVLCTFDLIATDWEVVKPKKQRIRLGDFGQALNYLKGGTSVRRKVWDTRVSIYLNSEYIFMEQTNDHSIKNGEWRGSNHDLLATDWETY